jgi:hypothetical protein
VKSASWRQVTPYRVEVRQGGGWLSVFGLPFFGAGIFMWLSVAGIVRSEGLDSPAQARVVLPLMALLFTAVGAALAFGRAWTAIDRAEGTLEHQWGLLVPMRTETSRITDCIAVVIGFTPGDSDSADSFPLTLKSRGGSQRKIFSASSYADARECAALVARLLNVDIEDATSDHAVRVAASKGALSLPERLRIDGPDQDPMPRPSNMRSEVRAEGNGVSITIPAGPVNPFLIVATLVPVAIIVAVFGPILGLFSKTKTTDPVAGFFFGSLAFLFAALPSLSVVNAIIRARRGATIVTMSPDGIRIDERGAWRTTTTGTYSAADVFDVDYSTTESMMASARRTALATAREADGMAHPTAVGPGLERVLTRIVAFARSKGITLKTRRGLVSFGAGLGDDEIRYLHALTRRALGGSPRL